MPEKKYAITLTPAFFPVGRIGVQPAFQFKIKNRFALITEGGIPIRGDKDFQYKRTNFFKVATELKYYPVHALPGRFYSLQVGYIHRDFQDTDSGSYYASKTDKRVGYSNLKIKSPVFFTAIKIGREIVEWKRCFADVFLGLGVRVIPTKYQSENTYTIGPWTTPRDGFFELFGNSWEHDQGQIRLQFSVGVRIGKRF